LNNEARLASLSSSPVRFWGCRSGSPAFLENVLASFEFCVHRPPFGKQRAIPKRESRHIQMRTPPETRDYEEAIAMACAEAMSKAGLWEPLPGPIRVDIDLFYPIPGSWPAWKRELAEKETMWCTVTPDKDNCEKSVLDGMNAVAYADDAYVVTGGQRKIYSPHPRVEVRVKQLGLFDGDEFDDGAGYVRLSRRKADGRGAAGHEPVPFDDD
jgi:Holliday junction resolvase RusA-like endonuclease